MSIRPSASALAPSKSHSLKRHIGKDHHHSDENDDDDDEGDIDVDGDDDKCNNKDSSTKTHQHQPNSGIKSQKLFHFQPFSSSVSNHFGINLLKNDEQNHANTNAAAAASLKFSIEDILRPDFGLTKFQLLAQHQQQSRHSAKRARSSFPPNTNSNNNNTSPGMHDMTMTMTRGSSVSVSSSEGHRPYKQGPSSVIYHSEDSNGSCNSKESSRTRMEPEVVDDTKVNPPVPEGPLLWPAWVYCTRYSDRPSSGEYRFDL
jgi:hypothetical protein